MSLLQIYAADTAALAGREEEALARLSPQRRERALRLPPGAARLRSVAAGLLLRRYIGAGPLPRTERGKPYLPGGPAFCLSHSGALAVLALSPSPVGVDVERGREWSAAVARRVLTPAELNWLSQGGDGRFFFLWTRKEAVMKATGLGFALPPGRFSVLPGERVPAAGAVYTPETRVFSDYTISAAVENGDARFTLIPVEPDTLLE